MVTYQRIALWSSKEQNFHFSNVVLLTVLSYIFTRQNMLQLLMFPMVNPVSFSQKQCRCMSSCLAVEKAVFHVICSLAVKFLFDQSAILEKIKQ